MQSAGDHLSRAGTLFSSWSACLHPRCSRFRPNEPAHPRGQRDHLQPRPFPAHRHVVSSAAPRWASRPQTRLLERTHAQLRPRWRGADAGTQTRLGAINQELSGKFTEFNRRLLADEDTAIFINTQRDLAGLPQSIRDASRAEAVRRGRPNAWAIANTRSSVDPFLTFSENRRLREQVWRAFKNRGDNGDANDTNAIIAEILALRAERAQILGFATHAHLRMDDTMARDPARAQELMERVWRPAVARVHQEVADMQAIANRQRANITIEPWDYLFYAEQVRRDRYSLDQNEVREYFELNNMINGMFFMAGELYGLTFREVTGTVPVFHQDVRVFEVSDRDGSYQGLCYFDAFARPGKRSGAWASGYQGHQTYTGRVITPITSNNNNFVQAPNGQPTRFCDDVQTRPNLGHAALVVLRGE